MSFSSTRSGGVLAAFDAGCDRLVHPSVVDEALRARHARTISVMLSAPFVVLSCTAALLPVQMGIALVLAAICGGIGVAWLGALLVGATARDRLVGGLAMTLAAGVLAVIIAGAGGLASPMLLLALCLPFEAWWVARTRSALLAGALAAVAVIPLQFIVVPLLFADVPVPTAAQWLAPLAYAAFALLRLSASSADAAGNGENDDMEAPALAPDAAAIRLNGAGDVADISATAGKLLGVRSELLLSTGLFDRIHVADRVTFMCALSDLRHGAGFRRIELRIRSARTDGGSAGAEYKPFVLEMTWHPTATMPIGAILRPNDEVVELRCALAKAQAAAQSAEIANSRFVAGVSHELRTPLNAIIGFSDMLLHEMFGGFANQKQQEYVGLVRQSGQHLLSVVNSMLDLSKIESGAYATTDEPFNFREAAEMCSAMLAEQAGGKGLAMSLQIASEIGAIQADRRAVQQILINLLSNAVKFTPEGGAVTLGASRVGSRLHFWVSDTGIGISADDLARVGTPFVQLDNDYTRRFEGTGLGLSLVKGLVGLQGGTMSIESEPGRGTTVTISLPVEGSAKAKVAEVVPLQKTIEVPYATLRKTA